MNPGSTWTTRRGFVSASIASAALAATAFGPGAQAAPRVRASASGRKRVRMTLAQDGTDQSAAVQAAIDNAPQGSHLLLPAGRYRLDRRILIADRSGLVVSGPKHEPFIGYTDLTGFEVGDVSHDGRYSYRQHWQIVRSEDVTLKRVHVQGPNTRRDEGFTVFQENVAFEHAFCINGPSNRITISRCRFDSVNGDGVYVGGIGEPCRDVLIDRVRGNYPGRQSIALTNVDGLLARRVRISGGGRSGVDIEPNAASQFVRNVELRELDMGSRFYPYVVGGSTDVVRRENISLIDCTAHRSSSSHPAVLASRNGTNLRIDGHLDQRQGGRYGIVASGWTGVAVTGSTISAGRHTPTSYGVCLKDCDGVLQLGDNDFNGGALYGFDKLFEAAGNTDPAGVTHSGNSWSLGTMTD